MVEATFNKKKGILESMFIGDVTIKEIIDYIISIKNNKAYPRTLKVLTDARKSSMNFTISDLSLLVEENNKLLEKYDFIIDAIIIDSPKETALSILYKEFAEASNYKFNIFSTREAAIQWLLRN